MEMETSSGFFAFSQTQKKMYDHLTELGIYLPNISSPCITDEYLEGIHCNTFY